jgi:hypothetical protein
MSWSILLKALPTLAKLVPELRGRRKRRKMEKLLERWIEAMAVVEDSGMESGDAKRSAVLKMLEAEFSGEMEELPEQRKNLITEVLLPFVRGDDDDGACEYSVDLILDSASGYQKVTGTITRR